MLGLTEIGPTTLLCDAAVSRPLKDARRNDSPTVASAESFGFRIGSGDRLTLKLLLPNAQALIEV